MMLIRRRNDRNGHITLSLEMYMPRGQRNGSVDWKRRLYFFEIGAIKTQTRTIRVYDQDGNMRLSSHIVAREHYLYGRDVLGQLSDNDRLALYLEVMEEIFGEVNFQDYRNRKPVLRWTDAEDDPRYDNGFWDASDWHDFWGDR